MIERYTRPEMGQLWTQENRFRTWLEVELAVCEAWHELGVIPGQDMEAIRSRADFDLDRILTIEEQTRHDVIAFLTAVEEKVGPSARFIHLGCTSSDILDTSGALLLVRAGRIILAGFDSLLAALKDLALRGKGMPTMGRTHGIHAEPTSFGLKMAGFYAEFKRHRADFVQALDSVGYGKISGAVGTYAFLSPQLEEKVCRLLGLKAEPVSTQVIPRDRYARYFTSLALTGGGVERLCVELRHLQRTEVYEVEEGFAKGQKGSSAMPHKRNPISAENLSGLARLLRGNAVAAMENMALWHERDISHSSVERVIMPDSTILMDYMLNRLAGLVGGLRLLPENMIRNMESSHGLYFSQRLLTALIETGLNRQEAYVLVQAAAMRCVEEGRYFPDEVMRVKEVTDRIPAEQLKDLFDPCFYLRHEEDIFARVFGPGEDIHGQ